MHGNVVFNIVLKNIVLKKDLTVSLIRPGETKISIGYWQKKKKFSRNCDIGYLQKKSNSCPALLSDSSNPVHLCNSVVEKNMMWTLFKIKEQKSKKKEKSSANMWHDQKMDVLFCKIPPDWRLLSDECNIFWISPDSSCNTSSFSEHVTRRYRQPREFLPVEKLGCWVTGGMQRRWSPRHGSARVASVNEQNIESWTSWCGGQSDPVCRGWWHSSPLRLFCLSSVNKRPSPRGYCYVSFHDITSSCYCFVFTIQIIWYKFSFVGLF